MGILVGQFHGSSMSVSEEQSAPAYSSCKGDSIEDVEKKKERECLGCGVFCLFGVGLLGFVWVFFRKKKTTFC